MRAQVLLAAALPLLLAGGSAELGPPLPASTVYVQASTFVPSIIAVPSGGTVAWVSLEETEPHFLLGPDFYGDLPPGATFRATIAAPTGSLLPYSCVLHAHMLGNIVVV